jgi:hypothetical protein
MTIEVVSRSVWPSFSARAAYCVPSRPPAPGRLSTMTATPERLIEFRRQKAGDGVCRSTCGIRHDDCYGPRRIGLRLNGGRPGEKREGGTGESQKTKQPQHASLFLFFWTAALQVQRRCFRKCRSAGSLSSKQRPMGGHQPEITSMKSERACRRSQLDRCDAMMSRLTGDRTRAGRSSRCNGQGLAYIAQRGGGPKWTLACS